MAHITLHMRPADEPIGWDEFCRDYGPYSVALDGYVASGPCFDETGPRINLDHHTDVDRLATRATCAQVFMVLCQGLYSCFRDDDGPRAEVYVNDCDEDVCLSWFLMKHAAETDNAMNPLLCRLVGMVDVLDTTGGAYPFPLDLPLLEELAWVFEPYRRFRISGKLDLRRADSFRAVVQAAEARILEHIHGRGQRLSLDTRYRRLGGGADWALIEEVGAQARTGVFADGIHAYVSARPRSDGRWTYTVGRMSVFIPFDVPAILRALNEAEGYDGDSWGGSNIIGGSPRIQGSALPPREVERIVNRVGTRRSKAAGATPA
jgi:hypothetical protein